MALSDRVAVLNAGRIEQSGPPLEIYRDPSNLFVAGFVGSPPINVLDAHHFPDLVLPAGIPASGVVVGLRPTDVRVTTDASEEALPAVVQLVEPTGNELWVVGRIDEQRIMGRGRLEDAPVPGRRAFFEHAPEQRYLFERDSGRRVRQPPA